ncbi:MAG: hypothetical protein WCL34_10475, partial [Methylococcaceae bacterium]
PKVLDKTLGRLHSINTMIDKSRATVDIFNNLNAGFFVSDYFFQVENDAIVTVTLINLSEKSLPCLPNIETGCQIFLSYHWKSNTDDSCSMWDGVRTELPCDIKAHSASVIDMKITSPKKSGSYTLQFDMVLEGSIWYSHVNGLLATKLVNL